MINLDFKVLGAIITIIKLRRKIFVRTCDKKASTRKNILWDNLFFVSLTLKNPEELCERVLGTGFNSFKLKKIVFLLAEWPKRSHKVKNLFWLIYSKEAS